MSLKQEASLLTQILLASLEKSGSWERKWETGGRNKEMCGELCFGILAGFLLYNFSHSMRI